MPNQRKVLLGGTTSENKWRDDFIDRLVARGISRDQLYNPIVEHWTREVQAIEDAMKADPNVIKLFYLGDTGKHNGVFMSFYSVSEALMGLFDAPNETAVLFDEKGLVPRAAKRLMKMCADWRKRFPAAPIFTTEADFEEWAFQQLAEKT